MNKLFCLILPAAILTCCTNPKAKVAEQPKFKDSATIIDTSFLADKNFVYKNLANTEDAKIVYRHLSQDAGNNIYTDSTFKRHYVALNKYQKAALIAPFISKELDVEESYSRDLMNAFFIAKQDKIGDLQPVIIYIFGDDYGSTTMILLDKNKKYVNGFNLSGGFGAGPTEMGNSLMIMPTIRESIIKKNIIITKEIIQSDYADSLKRASLVDSTLFKTIIEKTGKFKTKQTVKVKYTIPYKDS